MKQSACLFANESQKRGDLDWRGGGEELGGAEGRETILRLY